MNPEKALYLLDTYKKEFESTVKSAKEKFIVLEQTVFYPNSGGQPHDTGKLVAQTGEEYKVVYVGKFEGEISHEVDKPGLKPGDKVKGMIDWERRHNFMRYHTASHILSGLMHKEAGAEITGNQISEEKARIDFALPDFDRQLLESFEQKANEIIGKSLAVELKLLEKSEALKIPEIFRLRKAFDDSIEKIRIVEIKGFDLQACGGCHVKNTSEISPIEIFSLENKGKDRKRVYFRLKQ